MSSKVQDAPPSLTGLDSSGAETGSAPSAEPSADLLRRLLSKLSRHRTAASINERCGAEDLGTLENLLATLEARVRSFAVCDVAEGDALSLPAATKPFVHYILKGSGTLEVEQAGHFCFSPHTFIIVPPGRRQRLFGAGRILRDAPALRRPKITADHIVRMSSRGDKAPEIVATCGSIEATYKGSIGMFDFLDRPIAVTLKQDEALRKAFELLLEELATPRLGSRALTEALLKQCLVLLVRKMTPGVVEAGLFFGMADPRLVRALLAITDSPAENHTLERLANIAGMSRSSFAAQFQRAFGVTPIDLLRRVRLQHAARLLESTPLPVSAIAHSIGYESRTYFSRAFHQEFGNSPRSFRKKAQRA